MSLNFDYLKPPAVVRPVEVDPVPSPQLVSNPRQCHWAEKTGNARKYARQRALNPDAKRLLKLKNQLRPVLFAADPHCSRCGVELQMKSARIPNFASVLLLDQVLCCQKCIQKNGGAE